MMGCGIRLVVVSVIRHSDNEVMLYVYKINTKNSLTRYFYGVYLKHDWGLRGHLRSNYKAITKQLQNKLKQIKY